MVWNDMEWCAMLWNFLMWPFRPKRINFKVVKVEATRVKMLVAEAEVLHAVRKRKW